MRKLERVRNYFDREGDDYDRYFKKKLGFQNVGRIVGSIYGGKAVDGRLNTWRCRRRSLFTYS